MRKLFSLVSAITFVAAAGMIAIPASTFAQTTTASTSIQAQLDLIASLTAQIQALQQQIQSLQQQQHSAAVSLVSSLSLGSQGDQVKILQAFLASNPNIYPEGLITGYFGQLTEQAVKRFQKENGLDQIGIVGPQTREKLNLEMENNPVSFENASASVPNSTGTPILSVNGGEGENQNQGGNGNQGEGGDHGQLCAIVPPGHLIAPGWLRKGEGESETPIIPPCETLPPGIENQLSTSTTTTTPPPMIVLADSGVGSSVTTSTATVSWTTNLEASSQVMYGTTSTYGSSTTFDATLVASHVETITGLTPGTVYHFQVVSANASGTATSSDMTFTTNALPVLLPPVISGITSSAASTTASVSWTTNEAATSQVYYGTANPLNLTSTSTLSVSNATLVTSHAFTLSGLTASTTYDFVVQSADASANTATSSQMSFTTTQ